MLNITFGWQSLRYDQLLKASHAFNILDSRGFVGVTERARYFGRMRRWDYLLLYRTDVCLKLCIIDIVEVEGCTFSDMVSFAWFCNKGLNSIIDFCAYYLKFCSLARQCAQLWVKTRETLGHPLGISLEGNHLMFQKFPNPGSKKVPLFLFYFILWFRIIAKALLIFWRWAMYHDLKTS